MILCNKHKETSRTRNWLPIQVNIDEWNGAPIKQIKLSFTNKCGKVVICHLHLSQKVQKGFLTYDYCFICMHVCKIIAMCIELASVHFGLMMHATHNG